MTAPDVRKAELAVIEAARALVVAYHGRGAHYQQIFDIERALKALDRARSSAPEPPREGMSEERVREILLDFKVDGKKMDEWMMDVLVRLAALEADVLARSSAPEPSVEAGITEERVRALIVEREKDLSGPITDLYCKLDGVHYSGLRDRIAALEAVAARKGEAVTPPPASATPTEKDWKRYAIYQKTEWDGSRNVPCAVFSVSYVEKMLRDCRSVARERALRECADYFETKLAKSILGQAFDEAAKFRDAAAHVRALLAPEKEA